MSKRESVSFFADNWAYLKTELSWLDRLLMLSVARQKQEFKAINQVARTAGDRATSHWWKGIVSFNQPPAYDDFRPPQQKSKPSTPYPQQLETRIHSSQERGILLGLPWLQEQLRLSPFEKKLILLVLAPEVNRRFGRLYRYLQQADDCSGDDLPTVDLCLRLLCRNDQEWRQARAQLVAPNSLFAWGLLEWVDARMPTLLARRLRLVDEVTAFLLAEQPDPSQIASLVSLDSPSENALSTLAFQPDVPWSQLVLPETLLGRLKAFCQAVHQVERSNAARLLLLTGGPGIGKTTTVQAISTHLQKSLTVVDLATLQAQEARGVLDALESTAGIVLLQGAQHWFGRQSSLEEAQLLGWLKRSPAALICLSTNYLQSIQPRWRQRFSTHIELPQPDVTARRQLLRQAIPPDLSVSNNLRWIQLARQLPLNGGALQAIAMTATSLAKQSSSSTLSLEHFQQAVDIHCPGIQLKARG